MNGNNIWTKTKFLKENFFYLSTNKSISKEVKNLIHLKTFKNFHEWFILEGKIMYK